MILLARIFPYVAAAAFVVAILIGAYEHGKDVADARWQNKWDEQALKLTKEKAIAERQARDEEQRRQSEIERIKSDAHNAIEMARSDAVAADLAATSLRDQADRLGKAAGRCTSNTSLTKGGDTASTPGMVLAYVLKRADERAGELAAAYDRSLTAGLACTRAYQSLTNDRDTLWKF